MIPKQIIQTSRKKPEQYVVDMIKERSIGWTYSHFNDEEVIRFLKKIRLSSFLI